MAFTYHIALTGTAYTEFVPSTEPKVTWQEQAGEIFLRPTIEDIKIGQLLNPSLYASLNTMYFNSSVFGDQLRFWIEDGTTNYYFRSSISNAKNDTEKRLFIISPEPDDAYQDVIDILDVNSYNFTYAGAAVDYATEPAAAFTNVDFSTFSDSSKSVTWTNSTSGTRYARLSLGISISAGYVVVCVIKNITLTGQAARLRLVDAGNNSISNDVILSTTPSGEGVRYIVATGGGVASIELRETDLIAGSSGSFDYTFYVVGAAVNQAVSLYDVIDDLLPGSQTVKSTFLRNDALPPEAPSDIATYITANPTKDYVTEGTAYYNHLYMVESGVITGSATNMDITLRDVMNYLKIKLNVFWYIDSEGYFRIEHAKYFRSFAYQIDVSLYSQFKPEIDNYLYNYDKSNIFSRINYSESNELNEDFIAYPVLYDHIKTSSKSKDISIGITTDLTNLQDNGGGESIVLIQAYGTTKICDVAESELTADTFYLNERLSWAYVFAHYWQYFGEADTADINNGTTLTLSHVKEFLLQSNIKFYYPGLVNWYQPLLLSKGMAWIKKIEHDLASGFYTFAVGFSPTALCGSYTADNTVITVDSTLITADAI